jgi:hypothetical protein
VTGRYYPVSLEPYRPRSRPKSDFPGPNPRRRVNRGDVGGPVTWPTRSIQLPSWEGQGTKAGSFHETAIVSATEYSEGRGRDDLDRPGLRAPPFFHSFGGDVRDRLDGCVEQPRDGEFEISLVIMVLLGISPDRGAPSGKKSRQGGHRRRSGQIADEPTNVRDMPSGWCGPRRSGVPSRRRGAMHPTHRRQRQLDKLKPARCSAALHRTPPLCLATPLASRNIFNRHGGQAHRTASRSRASSTMSIELQRRTFLRALRTRLRGPG